MCALRALCIVTIVTLWLWRQGLLHNHVRTKTIMCALRALCIVDHCDVWLWRQGLLQPGVTGSSALQDEVTHYRAYRARCHLILAMGHFILGGHFCPSPVNSRLFTDDYSRLPRIAGSSLNHMIRNCPTTSQETFNDGYNTDLTHKFHKARAGIVSTASCALVCNACMPYVVVGVPRASWPKTRQNGMSASKIKKEKTNSPFIKKWKFDV